MAIGMIQEAPNTTAEMYDAINSKLQASENPPEGLIFHSAGPAPKGGLRIFDVWESREAYERFRDERLRPAISEVAGEQGPEPPPEEIYELHDYFPGS